MHVDLAARCMCTSCQTCHTQYTLCVQLRTARSGYCRGPSYVKITKCRVAVLCCGVLCCAVLCCSVLCCSVPLLIAQPVVASNFAFPNVDDRLENYLTLFYSNSDKYQRQKQMHVPQFLVYPIRKCKYREGEYPKCNESSVTELCDGGG